MAPARRRSLAAAAAAGLAFAMVIFMRVVSSRADAIVDVATAEVVAGDFVDTLSFRGEIKASASALISAPSGAGDLQIVHLARNGDVVARGDIVVAFDSTKVAQTLAEKRTELRQAEAEIAKARAQGSLDQEEDAHRTMKGRYDVERAKLEVGTREVDVAL